MPVRPAKQQVVLALEDDLRERVGSPGVQRRVAPASTRRAGERERTADIVAGVARRPGHPGRRGVGAHHRVRAVLRGQPAAAPGVDRRAQPSDARRRSTPSSPTSAATRSTPTASGCCRRSTTSPRSAPPATRRRRTPRCGPSPRQARRSRRCWRSGAAPTTTARWSATSPTPTCRPASSATSTRTCPSTRRRPSPCCRPRSSSRSSSSTTPWNRPSHERPLEGFRLIDPTCGSGHFLLGAFARLYDRWDDRRARHSEPRAAGAEGAGCRPRRRPQPVRRRHRPLPAHGRRPPRRCGEHSLEDAPGFTPPPRRRRLPAPRSATSSRCASKASTPPPTSAASPTPPRTSTRSATS